MASIDRQKDNAARNVYVLTYTDAHSSNERLGSFASFEEAKAGGDRHFKRFHVGAPKWETNGIGAKAVHDGAKYEIKSVVI